jgi:ABC-2 type transport system permease protein
MRSLQKLFVIELKLFLREPMAAFFTLIFPSLLLLLFGTIWGNKPSEFFGNVGYVDTAVPAFTAMIIATSGLMGLSIQMATYRESGVLRRFKATPLRPATILIAEVMVIFIMTTLGMIMLIILGKLLYGLRFSGNLFNVLGAYVLSCFSFFSIGFMLAGVFSTARTALIGSMILFYPMLFLSGAALPREILPETMRRIAQVLPLTHVVNLLRGLWIGESWAVHLKEVAVLSLVTIVGVAVSAKIFRWE